MLNFLHKISVLAHKQWFSKV